MTTLGCPTAKKAQYSAALTIKSIVATKRSEPLAGSAVLGQASRQIVRPAPR